MSYRLRLAEEGDAPALRLLIARAPRARAILESSEAAAAAAGFRRLELMATLPGVPFYAACGYTGSEAVRYPLPGGVEIGFVPMHKTLPSAGS